MAQRSIEQAYALERLETIHEELDRYRATWLNLIVYSHGKPVLRSLVDRIDLSYLHGFVNDFEPDK